MKKAFLIFALMIAIATSASAEFTIRYKGYVDLNGGVMIPPSNTSLSTGSNVGVSTSHGVELFDGLFLGAGIDLEGYFHNEEYGSSYEYTELEAAIFGAAFFDVRYNFLRGRKVSPFVGTRFGGGWQSCDETGLFYFSPSVGVTFNFTERFGLDLGLAYKLYNSSVEDEYYGGKYIGTITTSENRSYNNIALTVGIHF